MGTEVYMREDNMFDRSLLSKNNEEMGGNKIGYGASVEYSV